MSPTHDSQRVLRRLDIEFSVFLLLSLTVLFIGAFGGASLLTTIEGRKADRLEKISLEHDLESFREDVLRDALFDKKELIQDTVDRTRADLNLSRLVLSFDNRRFESKSSRVAPHTISGSLPIFSGKYQVGEISYEAPTRLADISSRALLFIALLFFVFAIILVVFVSRWLQEKFLNPVRQLVQISRNDSALLALKRFRSSSFDIDDLKCLFEDMIRNQNEKTRRIADLERRRSISVLAAQVAHDIRSPLAALNILLSQRNDPVGDPKTTSLVKGAITRIHDIANNLLSHSREEIRDTAPSPIGKSQTVLVQTLLDEIVSEKRIQYLDRKDVQIQLEGRESAYGVFVKINGTEFKNVISNLVNNSAESFTEAGHIRISIKADDAFVDIEVSDDGPGIPTEIATKIGQPGITLGKAEGHGLGLSHAIETLRQWNGTLSFENGKPCGTTVRLRLHRQASPLWFVSRLILEPYVPILILDDEEEIHQSMDLLLAPYIRRGLKVFHFMTAREARKWFEVYEGVSCLCLFDHELIGQSETGLDLITSLHLEGCSVLVTGRHDDSELVHECIEKKVRLLPKSLIDVVPMKWVNELSETKGPGASERGASLS